MSTERFIHNENIDTEVLFDQLNDIQNKIDEIVLPIVNKNQELVFHLRKYIRFDSKDYLKIKIEKLITEKLSPSDKIIINEFDLSDGKVTFKISINKALIEIYLNLKQKTYDFYVNGILWDKDLSIEVTPDLCAGGFSNSDTHYTKIRAILDVLYYNIK